MTAILSDQADRAYIAEALDETLIVEAAAGTGKTTELVRRIVRIVETGRADITQIVAVTFTEKAAGELKLRLREALERARRAAGTRSKEREHLDRALGRLEEAQVSTIHGLCADLLRERPVEACVDPLFRVLTESQALRIYDDAFGRWLQRQLAEPGEGVRRSLRRPTFAGFGNSSDYSDGPIDRLRRAGWELAGWRDFEGTWQRPPFDRPARLDELLRLLNGAVQLLDRPGQAGDGLYVGSWAVRRLAEEVARTESVTERDYDRLEAAFIDLNHERDFRYLRKGTGPHYRSGVLRADVWEALENLKTALASFEADANADLAAALQAELRGCVEEYEAVKAKSGALDFLDLLLKTRNLIRAHAGVRAGFQARFKRIFVDEFQDTDPLQAEILLLLAAADPTAADWRNARPVAGKLFLVGDPKQSIYRFRRADVGIYRTVYQMLEGVGARRVTLASSFRARPNIQRAINAAFGPAMTGPAEVLQASYVPLEPFRVDSAQPSVIALPVPEPYGSWRVSNAAIDESLPDAVGAFVHWLINESGWKVGERPGVTGSPLAPPKARGFGSGEEEQLVAVQARHVCLLFRRFTSFGRDVTRPYAEALEARNIPHLLVGGRSFHGRAEIETLRAALAAIEWPDDELSVFATLRGVLFSAGDEELLEYRHRFGRLHPFRLPKEFPPGLAAIVGGLRLLQELHRSRNRVPVAQTVSSLLQATRAHVGFALEHGGEQVLANVSYVGELARRYEAEGGISFRGFVDELREQAESGEAAEAPILEEGSDGVRLMTVHKAKGLEFPVVVLADMTARLCASAASRTILPERNICAVRLAGCAPLDLREHEQEETARDEAEGVRVAYVAATRARDLLVVPAVGDEPRQGWLEPLNRAIYPPAETRREQIQAAACPRFESKDSVLVRPRGGPAEMGNVCPGLHVRKPGAASAEFSVVWWDPHVLRLGAEAPLGIRRPELIVRDVAEEIVESGLMVYRSWREGRQDALSAASRPSLTVRTVTELAKAASEALPAAKLASVQLIDCPRAPDRPSGRRFGALVHALLASVPLDGEPNVVERLAAIHGRVLGAASEEIASAAAAVQGALSHAILRAARTAAASGRCRRETPILWRMGDGSLVEGVIDLAFEQSGGWTVVDFKTDQELRGNETAYRRQVAMYAGALAETLGTKVAAVLMQL